MTALVPGPGSALLAVSSCPRSEELGERVPLLSTIISLVRLMGAILSNYPVEGPIMRLTFVDYNLMMRRRASHLHGIKLIELQAGADGVAMAGFCF